LLARRQNHFTPLSANGVRRVCAQTAHDAAPIDFVVSPRKYDELMPRAQWDAATTQRFWLYDCRNVEALSPSSNGPVGLSKNDLAPLATQPGHRHGERHAIG